MAKQIVIQLARLGDLMQSAPAVLALSKIGPSAGVDVLCAVPLVALARCLPGVERAIGWDGPRWRRFAMEGALSDADRELQNLAPDVYETAYNLNQHNRAKLAAHLLAVRVIGPGEHGPVSAELPRWAGYLSEVARTRGENRVHLADTWCGFCGVRPPAEAPRLRLPEVPVLPDLHEFLTSDRLRVAIVVGAGERDRVVPIDVWVELITAFLKVCKNACVVLVGGPGERETAAGVERRLDPLTSTRVWNATGRTTLLDLAYVLESCSWVLAADTGPLHLATMVGAKAVGFFFSRARVHETGPYGDGHWVWQADPSLATGHSSLATWPIQETVGLMVTGTVTSEPMGWRLWHSHVDEYGVLFQTASGPTGPDLNRRHVWEKLSGWEAETAQTSVGNGS